MTFLRWRDNCKKNGFTALAVSPNYYDAVACRSGLNPQFTDRLRPANILYDRNKNGEFFQLYSPVLYGGFFLEIVQRNAYEGYGQANAIFRIAAQKRCLHSRSGLCLHSKSALLRRT